MVSSAVMPTAAPQIHPAAVVDPSAQLAPGVRVGPYAIVHRGAIVGADTVIEGHAVIGHHTRIGQRNHIGHHAVAGTESQDMKFQGETSFLEIGDDNVIREFATLNRATGEGQVTRVGSRCRFLAGSHVAHNCQVGNDVVLANCALLGGEVIVEDHAIVGGQVGVHQFCRIGAYSIVGACSKVTQDILPYVRADGHPARPHGLNRVGMERAGFAPETMTALKECYRLLFQSCLSLQAAQAEITRRFEALSEAQHLIEFIEATARHLARPRRHGTAE